MNVRVLCFRTQLLLWKIFYVNLIKVFITFTDLIPVAWKNKMITDYKPTFPIRSFFTEQTLRSQYYWAREQRNGLLKIEQHGLKGNQRIHSRNSVSSGTRNSKWSRQGKRPNATVRWYKRKVRSTRQEVFNHLKPLPKASPS